MTPAPLCQRNEIEAGGEEKKKQRRGIVYRRLADDITKTRGGIPAELTDELIACTLPLRRGIYIDAASP